MIQILAYGGKDEMQSLRDMLIHLSVQYEELEYTLKIFTTIKDWEEATAKMDQIDLVICDVSDPQAVEMLVRARKNYREAKIIPIAYENILPSVYVRPDIFPCTLLWRPLETEKTGMHCCRFCRRLWCRERTKKYFISQRVRKHRPYRMGKSCILKREIKGFMCGRNFRRSDSTEHCPGWKKNCRTLLSGAIKGIW